MARTKVKPFTKILGLVVIGVGVWFGFQALNKSGAIDKIAPKKGSVAGVATVAAGPKISKNEMQDVLTVCVVTWGGYAGGQFFNGGFRASKNSRYFTEYGILVEFIVMDDFDASRAAWKRGDVDLIWYTADAFPIEAAAFAEFSPKIVFQSDWSRGGDAICVRPGINSVNDLRGKQISVAFGTPSHTFLLWLLDANNMTSKDVVIVPVKSAPEAATMAKSGNVDAAVVWSPDDDDIISKMNGWKVLKSTRQATHIIADIFYAKESYIQENEAKIKSLVEGWLRGAAEINSSPEAKQQAIEILTRDLPNVDRDFCANAIDNVRLCTFGDNKGFFNIDGCSSCVTGEQLYQKMALIYKNEGVIKTPPPIWRNVTDTRILRSINLAGVNHEAEGMQTFAKPTVVETKAEAFASKQVSIVFPTGSYTIDDNAKYIIDQQVVPILKAFGSARVRVEGNTDNVGGRNTNIVLSEKRARSAVDYVVGAHGFDRNRFVEVGNGPDKPVLDNSSEHGRARNRRTEFQLLN